VLPRQIVLAAMRAALDGAELTLADRRVLERLLVFDARGYPAAVKRHLKAQCAEVEIRSPTLAEELLTLFEHALPSKCRNAAERLLGMYTIIPKFPEMRGDRQLVAKKRGGRRRSR